MKKFFSIILLFIAAQACYAEITYPFSDATDAKRFRLLTEEIRCVVCQNQNIADSNAPLANDLRAKIYDLINEKKSNEEIKTYLVERYGEFILLDPPFNQKTLLLWLFPLIACAGVIFILTKLAAPKPKA